MDTPQHAWQAMYPPLQTHAHGWLDRGDGHEVYWEQCGNPLGQPALFVHGGPGFGCTAADRRWFDPWRWRIVLFDQRGAGRSRPHGGLLANDTLHLVGDIEALRRHLLIEQWLLFGGSWGATLALAYAQANPLRVSALVLRGVFTATRAECALLYGGLGAQAFETLLHDLHCETPARALAAARAWWRLEQDLMDRETGSPPAPLPDDATLLATARIGMHYARHAWFLADGQLLAQGERLRGVPGVIVQGTHDSVTPPAAAQGGPADAAPGRCRGGD